MEIIFYSHRVSYPNLLSAQVLPNPLKEIAISRLEKIKSEVSDYKLCQSNPLIEKITLQQIQDNINYLQAKDQSHMWQDFLEFNRRLDMSRSQGPIEKVIPEIKNFL